ncbi:uncharacterized protein LOC144645216 isoform X5 [Oculina patagonica]
MDVLTQSLVPKIVLFILLLSFATVTNSQGSVSTSRPSVIPTTSQTTPPVPPPPPVPSNSPPTSSNLLIRASRQYLVRKNVS